ncbi:hypothetical protein N6H18_17550 [Reichenbachiella agarivorans]|uniref:40-residue YVTN family beta-propeller repeat-containing protein n=1 Tax=Reichenbachiella agarivorans TaxID=2979464 RepID=A0ABY6CNQ6_9BACT|nr:DUF5074 domain-containing protein [Reichenbachiella agarivorans]UXP32150.1 hypothetical protein N6H18_17550 [Reichenbachiella agarivorans]
MKTNTLFNNFLKASLLVFVLAFSACTEDDGSKFTPGQDGFFIVNEGAWGNANTSLSYFDKATLTVTNNLFETNTGRPLGDQAQSMTVFNDLGYIVVQNSSKLEVISTLDYSSVATISEGLSSPTYFLGISANKGYVSDWGPDGVTSSIKIIDLTTNTITDSISTGAGTNQMVLVDNMVYAANSGGWGYDNTVVVIDTETDEIIKTIEVGDNPSTLAVDKNENVWVTGNGLTDYVNAENSTPAFLAKIDSENNTVELKINAPETGIGPSRLNIDSEGKTLVFKYKSGISTAPIEVTSVSDFTEIIAADQFTSLYGFGIDKSENHIIAGDAPDFTNPGSIKRYELNGTFIDQYTVGIGPNGIAY